MKLHVIGAATLALALAACGTNERERVQGGAAAGAATGAGVGALGGPVGAAVGAVIGGGAGAVTGATTSPRDVNLGRPLWRDPEVRTPLDENHRRSGTRRAAPASSTSRSNNDGAYMGGGMVVEPGGTPANPVPSATNSGTPAPATPTDPAPRTTP
ncbi:hypothetical protein NON00_14130 [Roseomonas sp. GC11]|uniref:hypothetical protein n=1 Tax=Roseomonas sp. GC11 TaxID=2950546 RepID=UPI00210A42B1|nr:hypothetical protein [Roseomonas sp. GC11]MCQ4161059.1 hypothetical protein [Roseomonas sp. GC11]